MVTFEVFRIELVATSEVGLVRMHITSALRRRVVMDVSPSYEAFWRRKREISHTYAVIQNILETL